MAQGRQRVDAIPATPPVYGLLVAADVVDLADRWQMGVEWAPEQIGGGGVNAELCNGNTTSLAVTANPEFQTADPFIVHAMDRCSTLGFAARDFEGRARRQLLAVQSFFVAREFQLGTIRDAVPLGNVALKDAILIGPSPAAVANAIAELEGAIGELLAGRRAMLHVTTQTFALMKSNQLIQQAGQKWVTAQGTIVAADAGYTTEEDGKVYAYATSLPQITLGEILFPASFEESVNRANNTVTLYGERLALVRVDGTIDEEPGDGVADAMVKVAVNIAPWTFGS